MAGDGRPAGRHGRGLAADVQATGERIGRSRELLCASWSSERADGPADFQAPVRDSMTVSPREWFTHKLALVLDGAATRRTGEG
ncbi:hypothetical protein AB0B45_10140 [Nonomuraea sp. NPDC049152]|uniref:hypothetical protein n=1 Tax=Nonomuraea sp. NPDC049152 TaxID=3154350 RepID=UPI0033CE0A08